MNQHQALMHVSQIVTRQMLKNNIAGSVVNLSSQASQAALEEHALYCPTKAAVDHLTRCMALELGPSNVRLQNQYRKWFTFKLQFKSVQIV